MCKKWLMRGIVGCQIILVAALSKLHGNTKLTKAYYEKTT